MGLPTETDCQLLVWSRSWPRVESARQTVQLSRGVFGRLIASWAVDEEDGNADGDQDNCGAEPWPWIEGFDAALDPVT